MAKESKIEPGRGLDIGTMWLAAAQKESDGSFSLNKIRDAFLEIEADKSTKQMLKFNKGSYIERDGKIILIGDQAIDFANIFKSEVRRPLSEGVIAAGEVDAQEILTIIIKELLGKPRVKNEVVHYSVPAEPIDKDQKIIYHEMVFQKIVDSLGFKAVPMNEAAAIAYSNASDSNFSAITISFGAGMCNICVMYKIMSGLEFSISRGGDWIDKNSAYAVGTTASRIAKIKETGINLLNPEEGDPKFHREREAISFHYKSLIKYALDNIANEFKDKANDFLITDEIPLIVAGGTSLAGGFLDLFKETFNEYKNFPIKISEIRHAKDPLYAVAEGLLVASLNYDEE
jgi:actin-like ATPase involved in cell morphogenesis